MAKKYFSDLNYSLGNEDTTLEAQMVLREKPKKIFSIAGCGSRALPMLCCAPDELVCADVAPQQIAITKLRKETILSLTYEDFLKFWGFPPYTDYDYGHQRKKMFFDLNLEDRDVKYFKDIFESVNWGPLLYMGKWEKTFATLAKIQRLILGKDYDRIFKFTNLEEQIQYYNNDFPMRKWKSVIFLLGNKSVFNALLYKGDFIKKNVAESHFEYYFNAFERLFTTGLARESFFANLCFFGKINHEDGNTVEAKRDNFEACKKALQSSVVHCEQMDFQSAMEKHSGGFDFVSLSDVPSYFGGELEKNFLQDILPQLKHGAKVVLRYYLRESEAITGGYTDVTPKYSDLVRKEKVQMYRIKILEKN